MKSLSLKYKNVIVFATLIQEKLTSVYAQLDTKAIVTKNIYKENIYKTNDLNGAIKYYIENYLEGQI